MRNALIAKAGAATAVVLAATGGLAVAHALPESVQNVVSHIGIGTADRHGDHGPSVSDESTSTTTEVTVTTVAEDTTVPVDTTSTTAEPTDDHGDGVIGGTHDDGCDHSCVTTTTVVDGTTTTTVHEGDNEDQNENDTNESDGNENENEGDHVAPPTTVDPTTPTSAVHDGGDHHGDHGGSEQGATTGGGSGGDH